MWCWTTWPAIECGVLRNRINLANCKIVKSVCSRGAKVVLGPTICFKPNKWPPSLSLPLSLLISLWLSLRRVKVRGFGRRGVGGTNPAGPRGLWTLISTWSALHYLPQNIHGPPPPPPFPTPIPPICTNRSTAVEKLSQKTTCLFLSSGLIVNNFLF